MIVHGLEQDEPTITPRNEGQKAERHGQDDPGILSIPQNLPHLIEIGSTEGEVEQSDPDQEEEQILSGP